MFPSTQQSYICVTIPREILTHVQKESYTTMLDVCDSENWKDRKVGQTDDGVLYNS